VSLVLISGQSTRRLQKETASTRIGHRENR
jgi:hypothetical protein